MTDAEKKLLSIMLEKWDWRTPTQIGESAGKDYNTASSWACRHLKALCLRGFVQKHREKKGLYRLTFAGRAVAKMWERVESYA